MPDIHQSGAANPAADPEDLDVVVVGAGLSGIGAACHLTRAFPGRGIAVLEARGAVGGTWDLFRYPGVRSDSDMYTLGYRFRPWRGTDAVADGASVLTYLQETARESGVTDLVRLNHRVTDLSWSSERARWTVSVEHTDTGRRSAVTARLVLCCTGYYRYDRGHAPSLAGAERFSGRVVHPQDWPADLDVTDRRVVVLGSGATAVTLVPALADRARHVTMLQRSPSYIVSRPSQDGLARSLASWLPAGAAYRVVRAKNLLAQLAVYELSRRRPALVRTVLRRATRRRLPPGVDVDEHFRPRYDPWDQRLCVAADGDLFAALRSGRASVVTDVVAELTPTGVRLASGGHLDADVVVSATGLELLAFGGIRITVDDHGVDVSATMAYRQMMLSDVPNLVFVVGYTNASWTLKADLVSQWVVRLMRHMDERGACVVVPAREDGVPERPFLDFSPGYVLRSVASFPRQGDRVPWRLGPNYLWDVLTLRYGGLEDGVLRFESRHGEHPGVRRSV